MTVGILEQPDRSVEDIAHRFLLSDDELRVGQASTRNLERLIYQFPTKESCKRTADIADADLDLPEGSEGRVRVRPTHERTIGHLRDLRMKSILLEKKRLSKALNCSARGHRLGSFSR